MGWLPLLLWVCVAWAQPAAEFSVQRWGAADGLPQSTVTDLAVDDDGYLWVSTFGGLGRFDGESFLEGGRGEEGEALATLARVTALLEDGEGGRWIGLESGELWHHTGQGGLIREAAELDTVWRLRPDGSGRVLAATASGLWRRAADGRWSRLLDGGVFDVAPDDGRLWVAQGTGLVSLGADGSDVRSQVPDRGARCVFVDPMGDVWLGGYHGGYLLVGDAEPVGPIEELTCMEGGRAALTEDGRLWWSAPEALVEVGSLPEAKAALVAGTWRPWRTIEMGARIRSVTLDPAGQLWVGLIGAGLVRVADVPYRAHPTLVDDGLGLGTGPVVVTASGERFYAEQEASLLRSSPGDQQPEVLALPERMVDDKPLTIQTLMAAGETVLLTRGALIEKVGAAGVEPVLEVDGVEQIDLLEPALDGLTWVAGTPTSLRRLDLGGGQVVDEPLPEGVRAPILAVLEEPDGRLLIGHAGGVHARRDGQWTAYLGGEDFPRAAVRDLTKGPDGRVWVATYGGGLGWIDEKGRSGRLTRRDDRLLDDHLSAVHVDEDGLWLQGNIGLARLRFGDLALYQNLEVEQLFMRLLPVGEASGRHQPSMALTQDGQLLLAQVDRLLEVDLDRVKAPLPLTAPRFERVETALGLVEHGPVRLESGDERTLQVALSVPSLGAGQSVRLQHRLVAAAGEEPPWSAPTMQRVLQLVELPVGAGRLEVRALGSSGAVSEVRTLALQVQPRLWERAPTWVLAGLMLTVFGGWFQRRRTRVLVHANQSLKAEVAERERYQALLAEREAHYRLLFETAASGVLLYSEDGVCVDANPQALTLFNATAEQLATTPRERLGLPPLASDEGPQALTLSSLDGQTFEAQVEEVQLSSGFLTQVTDLSGLRQAEAQQRHLQEQLEAARRTESLARLAGGVAHDVNNVITAVLGNVELVEEELGDVDEQLSSSLTEIRRSAEHGAELVQELLTLGRRDQDAPAPLDPNEVIRRMVRMLSRLLPEDVQLRLQLGELPHVLMSRAQLEQVVANLVLNAGDALPGGGKIWVDTELADGGVLVLVRDDGVGMAPDVLERVFQPFYTTKGPDRGTGLGLASVQAIVQRAGGRIEAESVPGVGSTFRVWLPGVDTVRPAPRRQRAPESAGSGAGKCIWVCDDNPAVCRTTARLLKRAGFRVRGFLMPVELLDALIDSDDPPDMLVTDVVMPGLNGKQLAEKVREQLPALPVLFVSAYTADVALERGVGGAPGDVLLHKPFAPSELVAHVQAGLVTG